MTLHSKNIAISAGAHPEEIDIVSELMIKEKNISVTHAKELIEKIRNGEI